MSFLENFLFLSCFFIIPVLGFIALRISDIRAFDIHPVSVFNGFYLLFAYIGIPVLYFQMDSYRVFMGVTDDLLILKLWVVTSSTYLIAILTFSFLSLVRRKTPISFQIIPLNKKLSLQLFISSIYLICLIVFFDYIFKLDFVPLFHLFSNVSFNELSKMRSDSGSAFIGKYHWYRFFYRTLPVFLSYFFFADLLTSAKKERKYGSFCFSFCFAVIALLLNLEKAPIIWFIIGLFFIWVLCKKVEIRLKHLVIVTFSIFLMLVPSYSFFMGASRPISSIFSRVSTGELTPGYFYLKTFPETIEYLFGASFPNPQNLLPFENYRLTIEIMNIMMPDLSEKGIVGSAPTAFWGELYANFGFGGVVTGALFVGTFLWLVSLTMHRKKQATSLGIAAIAWLLLEIQKLSIGGFSSFFFNVELYLVLFLIFLLGLISRPKRQI